MRCKHPLKGFICGEEDGKKIIKVAGYEKIAMELRSDGTYIPTDDENRSPYAVKRFTEYVDVPCGRCMSCRLNYAKQWSDRCMMESLYHDSSYFVTLTYDDENLPSHEFVSPETGEVFEGHSLVKKDFQSFMKRLRRSVEYHHPERPKIRFFACGEYGESSKRPHYHAIIFGLKLDDLVQYSKNHDGDLLYNSEYLSSIWKKGHVVIGDVTPQSANYVARYVTKKQYGKDAQFMEECGYQREFTLMSRKPGIGRDYYEDNKNDLYEYEYKTFPTRDGSVKVFPPKYFDNLLQKDNPEQFAKRTEWKEKFLSDEKKLKEELSSKPYNEILQDEEFNLEQKIRILTRDSV